MFLHYVLIDVFTLWEYALYILKIISSMRYFHLVYTYFLYFDFQLINEITMIKVFPKEVREVRPCLRKKERIRAESHSAKGVGPTHT